MRDIRGQLVDGQTRLTAEQDRKRRSIQPKVRFSKKLSRNAPCFCGSGKKLKNCCMTATLEERHRLNNPLEELVREHLSRSEGHSDEHAA